MEKKETQMDVMIQETRQYIMDNLTITSMSNEELEDKIEELIFEKTKDGFFSIEEKVQMVQENPLQCRVWFHFFLMEI